MRIKRAVLARHFGFSEKARWEMADDGISELDVAESVLNAVAIYKKLRSRSPLRVERKEYLYVIISPNLLGLPIYTKGKLISQGGRDYFYFLVSFPGLWETGNLSAYTTMNTLTHCPNCGSKRFRTVRKDLREEYDGQPYVVRGLEFQECSDCGERMFSPEVMQRIEAVSPAYSKRRGTKHSTKAALRAESPARAVART